ncbi:MAG: X-Pro dipeptidyl-peptidase, partial [Gammaproteobacteria bacterium HGW-Gammaproteobacteria-14]
PFDASGDIFRRAWPGADLRFLKPNGGFGRPRFIPVHIAGENEVLAGIPEVDLRLDSSASKFSTRAFIGIGVQRAGARRVFVASEQLTPLPRKGLHRKELPAISMELKAGDRVGLVVYGYSWHYFTNPSFWWNQARIGGELKLPVIELQPGELNTAKRRR